MGPVPNMANQIMNIEWDVLSSDNNMGSREEPSPNCAENGSGVLEVVGPLILYDTTRLFADASLRFNMEVLSKRESSISRCTRFLA